MRLNTVDDKDPVWMNETIKSKIQAQNTLLFLVYIIDLPNELKSNVKLYADDTSLFTRVRGKNECVNILNNDLLSISK